jgi:predicted transcriptional regulator
MLLSINPQHVQNILNGTKRYEFRKVRCRPEVDSIVIYATAPVGRVVGEVELIGTHRGSLDDVWERTARYSGISRSFYEAYYSGCDMAVAYELGQVLIYEEPLLLHELGVSHAPQSFMYIGETMCHSRASIGRSTPVGS